MGFINHCVVLFLYKKYIVDLFSEMTPSSFVFFVYTLNKKDLYSKIKRHSLMSIFLIDIVLAVKNHNSRCYYRPAYIGISNCLS
jgi:hypothetical protein